MIFGRTASEGSMGDGACAEGSNGNLKLWKAAASGLSALDCFFKLELLGSRGVVSADAVPGRRRGGRIGTAGPGEALSSEGLVASYKGDGCLGDNMPRGAAVFAPKLDVYCKLVLRP